MQRLAVKGLFMDAFKLDEATSRGLARSTVARRVRDGSLVKVARGIYAPAQIQSADLDWVEAAARRPEGTICLISALAHHDLIDDIPQMLDVAIPGPSRIPASQGAIAWHVFSAATFEVGREPITIPGTSARSWIYSPERCIVDAVRLRGQMGYETGRDALKAWLSNGGRPAALMRVATQLPRSTSAIHAALEMLS